MKNIDMSRLAGGGIHNLSYPKLFGKSKTHGFPSPNGMECSVENLGLR